MNSKTKVAILYIATGRYSIFWKHFLSSAEKNLLIECNKHYFVFTDDNELLSQDSCDKVTFIHQKKLGWPYDTLMRFDIFLTQKAKLKNYDFIFYFNANTEILSEVTLSDLLTINNHQDLIFALQPHSFHKKINKFTYDRNPNSSAYIPYNSGKFYFTGALNGGKSKAYLEMCETLNANVRKDLNTETIALWHDESHLNKYALNRSDIKILPPYFTRGESEYWKKSSKIMFSDKTHFRFGGHAYLRGETDQKIDQNEWERSRDRQKKRHGFRLKQLFKSLFIIR